jgi:hypothetical protein
MYFEEISFSICTLVRDKHKYGCFLESLKKCGFINDIDEVLFLDNTASNLYDSFDAIKYFSEKSTNRYIMLVHEDVLFHCQRRVLISEIERVRAIDSKVAIFGVAGVNKHPLNGVGHFISENGIEYWGFAEKGKVNSLDECFIIIDRQSKITVSSNLSGFHFYGTDLCVNARLKGFNSYVIDFPVFHFSPGTLDRNFYQSRYDYLVHLKNIAYTEIVYTTCTSLYAGNDSFKRYFSDSVAIAKPLMSFNKSGKSFASILLNESKYNPFEKAIVLIMLNAMLLDFNVNQIWNHKLLWLYKRVNSEITWWYNNWRTRV